MYVYIMIHKRFDVLFEKQAFRFTLFFPKWQDVLGNKVRSRLSRVSSIESCLVG